MKPITATTSHIKSNLEELGFIWNPFEAAWENVYASLVEYKYQYGDCLVPKNWPDNPSLPKWINKQRQKYKNGKLSQDRVQRLNELGFIWNTHEAAWEEKYAALIKYNKMYGHTNVPKSWKDKKLATWVDTQRTNYKKNKLNSERIERLESIGFEWSVN